LASQEFNRRLTLVFIWFLFLQIVLPGDGESVYGFD
jgi:hypothetical protein